MPVAVNEFRLQFLYAGGWVLSMYPAEKWAQVIATERYPYRMINRRGVAVREWHPAW